MPIRLEILQKLYGGDDPFAGLADSAAPADLQGWNSQHPYLSQAIDLVQPQLVIEIGVWKGGSTLFMADYLRSLALDAVVIAIDTWLGSWDHWIIPNIRAELGFTNGYPTLFHKFMHNVKSVGLQDYVIPLPLDSLNAQQTLQHLSIQPDIVHIDGGHDYRAVRSDIEIWWPQIKPGGILIGDDYQPGIWPGVCKAFDEFAAAHGAPGVQNFNNKCIFKKAS